MTTDTPTAVTDSTVEVAAPRRRRQWTYAGPRCPQCAGPLVFGEGLQRLPRMWSFLLHDLAAVSHSGA